MTLWAIVLHKRRLEGHTVLPEAESYSHPISPRDLGFAVALFAALLHRCSWATTEVRVSLLSMSFLLKVCTFADIVNSGIG